MNLDIHQYTYGDDNYGFLLHDAESGETACIDTGNASETMNALATTGWELTHIWITHFHHDHIDGLVEVKTNTGAHVIGPAYQAASPIPALDQKLKDGDHFEFAGRKVMIYHTPGHAKDMLNYYLPEEEIYFSGDTLFVMGCGRLFDGTPADMWKSMQKVMALPSETTIYSAHEYTRASAAFANHVDPDNEVLKQRTNRLLALLDKNMPTVPSVLAEELATNPFLRVSDSRIRHHLGMENSSDLEVFTELRARKDRF